MAELHVRPNHGSEGGWLVTTPDSVGVKAHTTTQDEAIERARDLLFESSGGTLTVHEADDSVREERSVG